MPSWSAFPRALRDPAESALLARPHGHFVLLSLIITEQNTAVSGLLNVSCNVAYLPYCIKKKKKSTIVNIIFRYYPFVSSITEPTCYA